jgi:hypothetical protein
MLRKSEKFSSRLRDFRVKLFRKMFQNNSQLSSQLFAVFSTVFKFRHVINFQSSKFHSVSKKYKTKVFRLQKDNFFKVRSVYFLLF